MNLRSGRLRFQVQLVDSPATVTAHAGLPLVIEAFRALGLPQAIRDHLGFKQRVRGYSETTFIETLGRDPARVPEPLPRCGGGAGAGGAHGLHSAGLGGAAGAERGATAIAAGAGPVRVRIFDVGGRLVRTLADGAVMPAGRHLFRLDARRDDGGAIADSGLTSWSGEGRPRTRLQSVGSISRARATKASSRGPESHTSTAAATENGMMA